MSGLVDTKMLIANKKGRWTDYRLNEEYEFQPEQFQQIELSFFDPELRNESDRMIFDYIRANSFITSHQVLEITRIATPQGANVALGRLMKMGLIEKVRKGRQFIYQLTN